MVILPGKFGYFKKPVDFYRRWRLREVIARGGSTAIVNTIKFPQHYYIIATKINHNHGKYPRPYPIRVQMHANSATYHDQSEPRSVSGVKHGKMSSSNSRLVLVLLGKIAIAYQSQTELNGKIKGNKNFFRHSI